MAERKWIALNSSAKENQASAKSVLSTDFENAGGEGEVCIQYSLSGYWEEDSPYGQENSSLLDVPEAGFVTEKGAPMLVREGLFIAVPDNARFLSVTEEVIEQKELKETYDILPVPEEVLETEELIFEKDEAIYGSDGEYPSKAVEYVETVEVAGVRCVHLFVYPFRYRAKEKKLTAFTELKITVSYTVDGSADQAPGRIAKAGSSVYTPRLLGYPQSQAEADSEEKQRMILISTEELAYSLRILEGVKSFSYQVEVVYLSTIQEQYPDEDLVEAIHSFLIDEHNQNPVSYVVLGGDVSVIPSKMVNKSGYEIANDNYYCSGSDRDKPLPLFALGRLPVSTVKEMNWLVDYAAYYNRFYNSKRKNAVFTSYNDSSRGYEECKRDIKDTLEGDFNVVECYDGKCTKKKLIQEINKGVGFVNYRGHGDYNEWQSGNGLSTKDISKLDVGRDTPNVLSIACNNCGIHKSDCLGVEWIRQLKGISFLGASAPSYTTVNHVFDKYLWEGIHSRNLTKIGDIFVWATLELYRNRPDKYTVTNILEYLLLGDPTADYMDDKSDKEEGEQNE